jgi:hypothetical protein
MPARGAAHGAPIALNGSQSSNASAPGPRASATAIDRLPGVQASACRIGVRMTLPSSIVRVQLFNRLDRVLGLVATVRLLQPLRG